MKVHSEPLTDQEVEDSKTVGGLEAVITVSLADVIDSEGLDQFNEIIYDYFPGIMLSEMSYEIVGFTPPEKCRTGAGRVANGDLHIKVRADVG